MTVFRIDISYSSNPYCSSTDRNVSWIAEQSFYEGLDGEENRDHTVDFIRAFTDHTEYIRMSVSEWLCR